MTDDQEPLINNSRTNESSPDESEYYDIDDLAEHLGGFGRYQKLSYALCCFISLSSGVITFVMTFTSATPKYRCFVDGCDPSNSTVVYDTSWLHVAVPFVLKDGEMEPSSCSQYIFNVSDTCDINYRENTTKSCSKYVFDKRTYSKTAVSEFVLTCDDQWLSDLGATLFMAGMFVGALFWGLISDKFGRRKCLVASSFLTCASSIILGFSPDIIVFVIATFSLAFNAIAAFQTCFVLGMELVGNSYRTRCGIALNIPFAFGEVVVGLMAYYVRDWRILQWLSTVPFTLACLLSFIIFPESLRWLMSCGKWEPARDLIVKISKYNKIELEEHHLPNANSTLFKKDSEAAVAEVSLCKSLKKTVILRLTANLCFAWFVVSLLYYGMSLNTRNMPGNIYMNFSLLSQSEVAAYLLTLAILDRTGRRFIISSSFILTGITCTAAGFIPPDLNWLGITLSVFGKVGVSVVFCSIYVYTAELYPTFMRNTMIGIVAMFGKIGSTLSPSIASLGISHKSIPYIIFGAFAGVAGILVLDLPETTKVPLPETVEDTESLFRRSVGCARCCSFRSNDDEDEEPVIA